MQGWKASWRKWHFNQAHKDELALATGKGRCRTLHVNVNIQGLQVSESLWCAGKTTRIWVCLERRLLWGVRDEKASRSQFVKRSANHVKEFRLYFKESILSKVFRSVFMELAISCWNVFLFTEIQWGEREMEMKRLRLDDHLLEVMNKIVPWAIFIS